MTDITLEEILNDAKQNNYAIPCLSGSNLEMVTGIINAAEEKNSPLIMCYNKQITPGIPSDLVISLIVKAARDSKVPVCTILDHGSDFNLIMKSIHLGLSSVMYDGSGLPFEENLKNTKEIVKIAHSLGVSVEAELGGVGGSAVEATESSSLESIKTVPKEAVEFVRETGIDALAIAFGNVHGKYAGDPKLDLDLVRKITQMVDVPLVMHGASGLSFDQYGGIIDSGISKINYFSAMCRASYGRLEDFMKETSEDAFCIHSMPVIINFWKEKTMELLDILRCPGKADNFNQNKNNTEPKIGSKDFIEKFSDIIADNIMKYRDQIK